MRSKSIALFLCRVLQPVRRPVAKCSSFGRKALELKLVCLFFNIFFLTDKEGAIIEEFIDGHFEVERRGAPANAAGAIIMGAVAGAIVAAIVPSIGDGHTAEVGADPEDDEPFRSRHTLIILLRVAKFRRVHVPFAVYLISSTMTDEQWLASPFECHIST